MAADLRTEAENGKLEESENKIALLLSHLTDLLATCIAQQEDIHNLDDAVQTHNQVFDQLTTRLQQLEQTVASPVASSSNTSDCLETLEIGVGSLKDGVQLQQTATQQLEQRICTAANHSSSEPRETTPKFDGREIFCGSTKTDPIPWFRKFELALQLHYVKEHKHHVYLYSRSGGTCQAWLDNLLSKYGVVAADLHTKINWGDLKVVWHKRFQVEPSEIKAMDKLMVFEQGTLPSVDWIAEYQRLTSIPDIQMSFKAIKHYFVLRSCPALGNALTHVKDTLMTLTKLFDKATQIIVTNKEARDLQRSFAPGLSRDQHRPKVAVVVAATPNDQTSEVVSTNEGDSLEPPRKILIRLNYRYKSALKTRYGHFEWVVMPFGLTNGPTTFQLAMTNEFRAMLDRFVLVYLDGILVYSRSLEDHLEHLRRVLETPRRAKYKANHDKCKFVWQELEYLGHFVALEGISPLSDKIRAIQEWPEPRNITDVHSLPGLAGYHQRFIKGYSKIAAHLSKLQCEDRLFNFGEDARESFLALKVALLSAEVFHIYNLLLSVRVTTDASGYGIGAVLEQHDGVDWHPVEYFSKKVPAVHSIDDARKKELLAFVHALKRLLQKGRYLEEQLTTNRGKDNMNNRNNNGNNGVNGNYGGYGGRRGISCYECGKTGHMARDCWSKRGKPNQHEDEVHVFMRELMEEKKEERRKKAEEEQKRSKEEDERRRELDITTRTEEMKLQLQADIEDKWRRQLEEAANRARENRQEPVKTESPKITPQSKTITKGKRKKARRQAKKTNKGKRAVLSSTSSDTSEGSSPTTSESSEDSEEDALWIIQLLRAEKQRAKLKKKQGRGRSAKRTPPSRCKRGECSKRSMAPETREKGEVEEEPRTPLPKGYKGKAAGCSREGFVDYTLQVFQEYSAKKVPQLREICEKEGIKTTKKDEMVMELAGATKVEFTARRQWTDGWKQITAQFGMSEVEVEGKSMLLKQAKATCQPGDWNPGDTALICPVLYRHGFGSTFMWNRDYETVVEPEAEILAKCKEDFVGAGLPEIGNWKRDGRLGKAYVIPKDKDLQRWRPIAPTCSDPAELAQRRGARALHCLITRFSRTKNFHLKSTMELKDDLEQAGSKMRREGCDIAMGRCYDIKEMFSSISHLSVKNAVLALVMHFEEQGWRQPGGSVRPGRARQGIRQCWIVLESFVWEPRGSEHSKRAKVRLKLDKLKHNKWTGTMHSLQEYVSKLFATPDLEMTAQSCLGVIKGSVPYTVIHRLGLRLITYINWLTLMRDLVKLEAQDLPGGSGGKKTTGCKRVPSSNYFAAYDLLEDDEKTFAEDPSLDDDQEQGRKASCSSSAHESEYVNGDEPMNAFKKTAFKRDNLRMCIQYRGLNGITRKNAYPLPCIDDLLDAAGGCKVFSKIDLKSGYHQIEVDHADQYKTAFKTCDGLYELTIMPFGLTNAPTTFQSLMDKVFRNQINRFVVVYLDVILIFSKSMEEHMRHLEEVLQILKNAQLHLNLEKSEFGRDNVIYLGHRLSVAGLEPEATKVEVIRKWPQLTNVRELRSFLGLASYYHKFVPKFSITARPLSRLTTKNVSYTLDGECTTAYQALKEALASHPVLRIADSKLTFIVTTDASLYGIGAVLQQDDGDDLRPLEFYSKRMPSHKVVASTYMRELYALREGLDHWKHYLLGRYFKVFSDHETLKWIQTQNNPSTTLTRRLHEIAVYDFELRHKKGCYNRIADALSRHPEYMSCLVGSYDLRKNLKEELVENTAKDPELSLIREHIQVDSSSQPDFHECKGLLF
ncbi:hypothetical protein CBR_g18829 [Chara braunii]|uniref:Reverse transcriptase n=1 Tax=Chara braunii TaxID=69332 RepID=A0A388KWK3_CHABU|nr:hypothetical protein CBR_g18829 [Chara braunii]|eukprot:GBG74417.1 hypothetical protein CBR_g18829 [Chara braunii]